MDASPNPSATPSGSASDILQRAAPPGSARDRDSGRCPHINISENERWGSAVGGAALLLAGLARGRMSGLLMGLIGGSLIYRGATGHCTAYQSLGISTAENNRQTAGSHASSGKGVAAGRGVKITQAITIERTPEDLFAYWRRLENLPRVMRHLKQVESLGEGRWRWRAEGPLGSCVQWDAEIHNERAPELISWQSLPGSEIDTAGSVHFRSLGEHGGTEVEVSLRYDPPSGKAGAMLASLLGSDPQEMLADDLRRFKGMMENRDGSSTDSQVAADPNVADPNSAGRGPAVS